MFAGQQTALLCVFASLAAIGTGFQPGGDGDHLFAVAVIFKGYILLHDDAVIGGWHHGAGENAGGLIRLGGL